MRFLKFAVLAALFVLPVSSAHAGLLGSTLTFNGDEDRLSTINPAGLATFVDLDATPGFSDGDVVYGFLVSSLGVNDYLTTSASAMDFQTGYAVAMFAAELETGTGGFNLVPVTTAGLKLEDLIDPVFGAAIAGLDAMVTVISGDLGGNPLSGFLSADNTSGDGLKFFGSGDFGLEMALDTHDAGSGAGFFQFAGGGGTVGQQKAGFNRIDGVGDLGSSPIEFLNVTNTPLFSPPTATEAHVGLDTTFVNGGAAAVTRGWAFETQSFGIRLNAVPEPGSLAIFAGIAIVGFTRRRVGNKS